MESNQTPEGADPVLTCDPVRSLKLTKEKNTALIGRASTSSRRRGNTKASPDNGLLRNPVVSREHAKFSYRNKSVYIRDCRSYHGTALNGTTLPPGLDVLVQDGDDVNFAILTGKLAETMKSCHFKVSISDLPLATPGPISEPDTLNKTGTYRAPVFLSDDESDAENTRENCGEKKQVIDASQETSQERTEEDTKSNDEANAQASREVAAGFGCLWEAGFIPLHRISELDGAVLPSFKPSWPIQSEVQSEVQSEAQSEVQSEAVHENHDTDTETPAAGPESGDFLSSDLEMDMDYSDEAESEGEDVDSIDSNEIFGYDDIDFQVHEKETAGSEDETLAYVEEIDDLAAEPGASLLAMEIPQATPALQTELESQAGQVSASSTNLASFSANRSNSTGETSIIPISYLLSEIPETPAVDEETTSPSPPPPSSQGDTQAAVNIGVCICETKNQFTTPEACDESRIMTPPSERIYEAKISNLSVISTPSSPSKKRKIDDISTDEALLSKNQGPAEGSISEVEIISTPPVSAKKNTHERAYGWPQSNSENQRNEEANHSTNACYGDDNNKNSADQARPRKRIRTVVEAVGFAALGGAAAGLAILTAMIATAPELA
ncbi:hypothetical protein HOO65_040599 [Ceratocystis lukuohia]|uniref:FHA domain-containing protein n=1 Tax=Ceratocystis lukuohia TaxID=2019550 RepID=A0ABR4MJ12_9PEZI